MLAHVSPFYLPVDKSQVHKVPGWKAFTKLQKRDLIWSYPDMRYLNCCASKTTTWPWQMWRNRSPHPDFLANINTACKSRWTKKKRGKKTIGRAIADTRHLMRFGQPVHENRTLEKINMHFCSAHWLQENWNSLMPCSLKMHSYTFVIHWAESAVLLFDARLTKRKQRWQMDTTAVHTMKIKSWLQLILIIRLPARTA